MKQILLIFVLLLSGITNAQTFDFSCVTTTTEDLISERKDLLSSIGENSNYVNNVSEPNPGPGNSHIYEVVISRTLADGTEKEYFHKGIDNSYLGNPDGAVEYGFDEFYAEALQASIEAEADGIAAALAMTAEELASLTASRTLELKAKGSATTSVTIRWDGGHIITVDGNDILARDHGHNNYGKSTQDQFDALLKVVEDAVIAADAAANLSVGDSRKKQLEDLSRDGVFVHVTNGGGEYKIEFTDSEDNPYGHIEGWEPVTISGLVNLEDISESNFTTYTLVQTENIITDILNGKYIIESITYDAFTVSEIDLATSAASTLGVLVDWEYGNFDEDHSLKGQQYVNVVLTDLTGNLSYNFTNQFLNGEKSLEDPTATSELFNAWVATWSSFITTYQAPIRSAYKQKLEAAFADAMPAEETDVVITLDNDENGDIITFSNVSGSTFINPFRFNEIIEDLPVATIDAAISILPGYISFLQSEISAANTKRSEYVTLINDEITETTNGTDVSISYGDASDYGGSGDALVFKGPTGHIYTVIQFNGFLENLHSFIVETQINLIAATVLDTQISIDPTHDIVVRSNRLSEIGDLATGDVVVSHNVNANGFDEFTITAPGVVGYTYDGTNDGSGSTFKIEDLDETAYDLVKFLINGNITQVQTEFNNL